MLLEGLTIMVTRPKPQGEVLCDHIRRAGGHVIYFPTVEIFPPADIVSLEQGIANFDKYDIIIFMSPQAVYKSVSLMHKYWPQVPPHIQIITIGKSTAKALEHENLPVSGYPEYDWSSEGLLQLPLLQDVKNKKIAIMQGEAGRELIIDALNRRGAHIESMIAYRRAIPKLDTTYYKDLLCAHKIDVIICTSNEILQNLVTLVGVQPVPLLVISKRMAELANHLGFKIIFLAENASDDAILSQLVKQKDDICQTKRIRM